MTSTRIDRIQLPRWLIILLVMQVVFLWGLWIGLMWFARPHWPTFLTIPIDFARLILFIGTIAYSGITVLAIRGKRSDTAMKLYGWLNTVAETPLGWILIAGLLALASYLGIEQPKIWFGHRLLSLFFLGALLIILLANPRIQDPAFRKRVLIILPLIVLVIGLALRMGWLLVGMVWGDEGFHLSATAGMLAGKNIAPANMFFPQEIIIPFWRGFAFGIYKLWAELFGLGLLQMRAMAYLFGVLALLLLYGTLLLWYDRRTALIGVSLSSMTFLLMISTIGRTDSLPMFAVSLTLFAHVYATRSKKLWLHAIVGLIAGLSLETHFALAPLIFMWAAYYVVDYIIRVINDRRILQAAPLWPFLAVLVPLMVAYAIVHIYLLPNPGGLFSTIESFAPKQNIILSELQLAGRRLNRYWAEAPVEILLIVLSVIAAMFRRTKSDRHWLLLFGLGILGYLLLGSNGHFYHMVYGVPIWMAGFGPLITYGWDREPYSFGSAHIGAFLVVTSLILNSTAQELVLDSKSREYFDAEYTAVADIIRQNTEPGIAIITPTIYIPYLIDHTQIFLHSQYPAILRGPLMAGQNPDYYWQTILLETWPTVRLVNPRELREELRIEIEYTQSFQAEEIAPNIWWIDWQAWTTDLNSPPDEITTPLMLVAHQPIQQASVGNALDLQTVWANREALTEDIDVSVSLRNNESLSLTGGSVPLIEGWDGSPTSAWNEPGFHNATFTLTLPDDLPAGDYALYLTIESPPALCQPWCEVALGTVTVVD